MGSGGFDVVTGAFSYSGSAIARELAAAGRRVRTLTGHPERAPERSRERAAVRSRERAQDGGEIEAFPLDFDDPHRLTESLRGARTLYNTYWVRFARGRLDHEVAVANSRVLFYAARQAGVERIVHVSITHPSVTSPYPYFRGKAQVERALVEVGVPYTVLRPAILFGGDGVLINNIAWLLRHLPLFAVGGNGEYKVRGIHVDDLARLCVTAGSSPGDDDAIIDAVGPERLSFLDMVEAIKTAIGSAAAIVTVPGLLVRASSVLLGLALRDTLLTWDEYQAMSDGLADTDGPATGHILFTEWLAENADTLGRHYANDQARHFR